MKLALDPAMYYPTHSVYELPDKAAELGFDWLEISPKEDFLPFFRHPRINDAGVARLRKILSDAHVGIAATLPLVRWSGPDETLREAAVRAWKRAIQITADLGVREMHSEFNGRPEAPELAEAMFLRSMDELLPVLEREGITLVIEPHPDDYLEDGITAIDTLRGLNSEAIEFQYCLPHAFHQGHAPVDVIRHAGADLRSIHVADAFDHVKNNGLRYILNPPETTARIHQHMELGSGDVPIDEVFAALAEIGFDGSVSASVFGWDEEADEVNRRMIETIKGLFETHYGAGTVAWETP